MFWKLKFLWVNRHFPQPHYDYCSIRTIQGVFCKMRNTSSHKMLNQVFTIAACYSTVSPLFFLVQHKEDGFKSNLARAIVTARSPKTRELWYNYVYMVRKLTSGPWLYIDYKECILCDALDEASLAVKLCLFQFKVLVFWVATIPQEEGEENGGCTHGHKGQPIHLQRMINTSGKEYWTRKWARRKQSTSALPVLHKPQDLPNGPHICVRIHHKAPHVPRLEHCCSQSRQTHTSTHTIVPKTKHSLSTGLLGSYSWHLPRTCWSSLHFVVSWSLYEWCWYSWIT